MIAGFKDIRIAILKKLGIVDKDLYIKLDMYYNRLFMDLALHYNDKQLYISNYNDFSKIQKPDIIYTYNYYRYKGEKIKELLYRLKIAIRRFSN